MGVLHQDMTANEIDKDDGEDFKAKFTSDEVKKYSKLVTLGHRLSYLQTLSVNKPTDGEKLQEGGSVTIAHA